MISYSANATRKSVTCVIGLTILIAIAASTTVGGEKKNGKKTSALKGSFMVKADEESFANAAAVVKVWQYNPFLADVKAKLYATMKIQKLSHKKGKATTTSFQLGDPKKISKKDKYYITIEVFRGKNVSDRKNRIFFLDKFNRVTLPGEFKGTLKKLVPKN